jgi:hypothetical protein
MDQADNPEARLLSDIAAAKSMYEGFEAIYAGIESQGKRYLQARSQEYRKTLMDAQDAILHATRKHCPNCGGCCAVSAPELNVYTARSTGCFQFIDYVLARCDTELPKPQYANMTHNRCAYLADNGCSLPLDCRSYTCTRYVCEKITKDLDVEVFAERIKALKSVIDQFSVLACLDRSP